MITITANRDPVFDHFAGTAEPVRRCFERWCGFGHVPSDGVHVTIAFPGVEGGPPIFSGALTGPIANLNAPSVSGLMANASRGRAIITAPIPDSRRSRRRMVSMLCPWQCRRCGQSNFLSTARKGRAGDLQCASLGWGHLPLGLVAKDLMAGSLVEIKRSLDRTSADRWSL